jgi:hypothetical protein
MQAASHFEVYITTINTTEILKDLLRQRPKIKLHDIRRSHSIFQTMSMDQLGLRVERAAHSLADTGGK